MNRFLRQFRRRWLLKKTTKWWGLLVLMAGTGLGSAWAAGTYDNAQGDPVPCPPGGYKLYIQECPLQKGYYFGKDGKGVKCPPEGHPDHPKECPARKKRSGPAVPGLVWVTVPAGTMPVGDHQWDYSKPVFQVQFTAPFKMLETEVTNAQYAAKNREHGQVNDKPVVNLDWNRARSYCAAVGGRLPSEWEWEYAARAGGNSPYGLEMGGGSDEVTTANLLSFAWPSTTNDLQPVKQKRPNAWSLYDLWGNAWELVEENSPKVPLARSTSVRMGFGSPAFPHFPSVVVTIGNKFDNTPYICRAHDDQVGHLQTLQTLIDSSPKSPLASAAHLCLGEYYFNRHSYLDAIPYYQAVLDLDGPDGDLYYQGLYKLWWSRYKMNDYEEALGLMDQLLVWSSSVYMDREGRESEMTPETIEYTAISLSDLAARRDRYPVDVAREFYWRVGERTFEPKVYKRLAEVLSQQAQYREAIATYTEIQRRWPNDPENPTFQYRVASLYMSMPAPEIDSATLAIAKLADAYNDGGVWWRSNQDNPNALAVALSCIEQTLPEVDAYDYASERSLSAEAAVCFGGSAGVVPWGSGSGPQRWIEQGGASGFVGFRCVLAPALPR